MADCTHFEELMNAWMDGQLTGADAAALDQHCAGCPACAEKLRATRTLKSLLSEMAPDADVPIKAQAAWRGVIKAEAASHRRRRIIRRVGAVAAALVLVLGGVFALKPGANRQMSAAPMLKAERNVAVIEADGAQGADSVQMEEAFDAAAPVAQPMHEWRMTVADLGRTCDYISDLVSEYEGTLDQQRYEADGAACANLYIDLPAENVEDFVKAARHYNTGGDSEAIQAGDEGRVSLLLVLTEAA
jgi:hypothetical protein